MKKNVFFLVAIATLALATSCSQDEQQSVNRGRAISFNAALNVTRARDYSTAPDEFKVYGTSTTVSAGKDAVLIPNALFKKDGTTSTWLSQGGQYFWPSDETEKVEFSAYAPTSLPTNTVVSHTGFKDFTVDKDVPKQVDLVVGTNTVAKKDSKDGGVPLQFDHALTRVFIKAIDTNPAYVCTITSVGFGNIKCKGDYEFKSKKWTAADPASFSVTHAANSIVLLDGNQQDAVDLMGNTAKDFKFVPQEIAPWDKVKDAGVETGQAYFVFNIVVKAVGGYEVHNGEAYVPVPKITWEAGKSYTYTLDFSNGFGYKKDGKPIVSDTPIKFVDVKISNWDEKPQGIIVNEKKTTSPAP